MNTGYHVLVMCRPILCERERLRICAGGDDGNK
jgi:hypothetical protein